MKWRVSSQSGVMAWNVLWFLVVVVVVKWCCALHDVVTIETLVGLGSNAADGMVAVKAAM